MKIKTMIHAAAGAIIGGLVAIVATNYVALQELKVRGPVYERIMDNKDLVADVIPPPLHLVEPYLEVSRIMIDPRQLDTLRGNLATHRKELGERRAHWAKTTIDPDIKASIDRMTEPSTAFWETVDREFLPAVAKQDMAAAKAVYTKLTELYHQHEVHEKATEKLLKKATADTETAASASEKRWNFIGGGVSIAMFLLAVGCVAGLLMLVLKPLDALRQSMIDLANGNNDLKVNGLGRPDEIGAMASAVDLFRIAAIEQLRLEQEQAAQRAREQQRQQAMEQQVEAFRGEISGVIKLLGEQSQAMRKSSSNLVTVSTSTTTEAKAAEQASSGAADNAQAVAAATEQLGASIREIASQAHRTSDIVTQTTEAARRTNADVEGLAEAAQKIGSIVEIIKNVAEQTNLLALNATIEAARAGEAGKGFAVVATEVKSLAAQTAKATAEISSQILGVQASTNATVESIRTISNRIDEINGLTGGIAAAVEQQEAATREIAQNVTSAADRSRIAAANVTSLLGAADQTKSEAATMTGATDELTKASTRISDAFDKFVAAVSNDITERRQSARHPFSRKAVVVSGAGRIETRTQDISLTGLRLTPVTGLAAGSKIQVDFGQGMMRATVVWSNNSCVGIAFEKPLAALPPRDAGLKAAA